MAKVELQPGEELVKQGSVPYLKGRFNLVQGGGYLTNLRFLHTNDMRALAAGGLVGSLLKGKVDIEIPLGSITRISRAKHGRNESVLAVETADGHEYRLLPSFDEWLQAFADVLGVHHGTKLVEMAPGEWTAQRS